MKTVIRILLLGLACFGAAWSAVAQKNPTLTPTPPMGWNSWNWFGRNGINEEVCLEVMEAMIRTGLRDAGYTYFIVDGGWRDGLAPDGRIAEHAGKFPRGLKFLSDYAHAHGFKFGLHTVPGRYDCGGFRVGGLGNEQAQLQQFLDLELDFIKLDKCRYDVDAAGRPIPWPRDEEERLFRLWSRMLHDCGRDIVLSFSTYRLLDWHPAWCNMSRTTGDIMCRSGQGTYFERSDLNGRKLARYTIMEIADRNEPLADAAGDGYWNDMDMLSVGDQGLTFAEQQIHFALWCIMSAPLFLGNDPRCMTPEELDLLTNREAIAVDQDPTEQGRRVWKEAGAEIWCKHLADGRVALLLMNRDRAPQSVYADFERLGLGRRFRVHDIYAKRDLGRMKAYGCTFEGRGCAFLLLE